MSSSTPITKKVKVTGPSTKKSIVEPKPVVEAPAVEEQSKTLSVEESVDVEVDAETEPSNITKTIDEIISNNVERNKIISKMFKDDMNVLKTLKRDHTRMMKSMNKMKHKRVDKRNMTPRVPSGIARDSVVSPEVSKFLGLEKGQRISHTNLTRRIHEYIAEKKLQDPENKQWIVLDASLKKLFGSGDRIKYMGLNKYTAQHFKSHVDADLSTFLGTKDGVMVTFDNMMNHFMEYSEKNGLLKDDKSKVSTDPLLNKLFGKNELHFDLDNLVSLVRHHFVSPPVSVVVEEVQVSA